MCSNTSLERILRDQVILYLRVKMPLTNIESTIENVLGVLLECLIGGHCLIGGCLGAGFHCMNFLSANVSLVNNCLFRDLDKVPDVREWLI